MTDLQGRVAILAALAETTRLSIVDLLTLGDQSSSEIGWLLGLPSNLIAHHLGVLEAAQIISRTPSESDKRRNYIALRPEVFETLNPANVAAPPRVLFVCTANSARSQLAEAIWMQRSDVPAVSAGIRPAATIHPEAIAAAARRNLQIDTRKQPVLWDDVSRPGDMIITVCDSAHEKLAGRDDLHWSIPDPAQSGDPDSFDEAYRQIDQRIQTLTARLSSAA